MLRLVLIIAVCGATFAALPSKIKCPYGDTGDCLGFAGKTCDAGSDCIRIPYSTGGRCCRKEPIDICPNGNGNGENCGGFANTPCQSGYKCIYQLKPFSTLGTCCKDVDVCNGRGSIGICGGIAALKCNPGTTCTDDGLPVFPDKADRCCIDKIKCPYGSSDKQCGGKKGLKCGVGYECELPADVIDGLGKCCRKPPTQGVCPPSSGRPGICIFTEKNCLGHEYCPAGQLCCSEGCGKICKPVMQIPGPYEY